MFPLFRFTSWQASEEHSPITKEGLILKCFSPGAELKKNVIRKAVCVVSLGPEKKEEEEEAPAPAAAAAAEEKEGGESGGTEGEEGAEVEAEASPLRDAGAAAPEGEGEEAAAA